MRTQEVGYKGVSNKVCFITAIPIFLFFIFNCFSYWILKISQFRVYEACMKAFSLLPSNLHFQTRTHAFLLCLKILPNVAHIIICVYAAGIMHTQKGRFLLYVLSSKGTPFKMNRKYALYVPHKRFLVYVLDQANPTLKEVFRVHSFPFTFIFKHYLNIDAVGNTGIQDF